ncbi:phytoene/squalene synthase family protein [Alterisphingorhabdus coralli]|uniref:Phytoene/squalene synthase family protein n=1 Tax=Alterisphingorhabdus coralli TaxID=3071408 RepID=A0AA97HZM6_9SPHN|nr:phytoene/squalene synthase family protein [Parasphingorhabdus sp. SCSIO 66989]WOE74884.1 phytoene/squalene synthase family protein [Parasphingorhabdus sp. SCSIO 66989]
MHAPRSRFNRQELVAHAFTVIGKGSRSFSIASRLFDQETRERAWLLYAWCRKCDDLADGQDLGHGMKEVDDAEARLAYIRERTAMAFRGEPTGEASFDCLGVVVQECGIPKPYAEDVIDGFALDVAEWRPRSEDDLYQYCYHVAGAVGCMMAIVMGVDPQDEATLDRACDLGMAFQLANIARDIEEDDSVGRCYLPMDWLAEMDIPPGQHMKPPFREGLTRLAKRLADNSERYEASARIGARKLPYRARWAVLAAAGIYGDIAREVRARGQSAWDHRTVTTSMAKLGWIIRSCWRATQPPRPNADAEARKGLWTRPHR